MNEYVLMFDDGQLLDGRSILDCAAGAASFAAQAASAGTAVVAVDRLYSAPIDEVIRETLRGVIQARQDIIDEPWRYSWGPVFASPSHHAAERLIAAGSFLHDYEANLGTRYVYGELPNLPFPDEAFGTVLSSHLLFAYAGSMGIEDHLLAVDEMLRVAQRDVRIYPLVGFDGDSNTHLTVLMEHVATSGHSPQLEPSRYAFFGNAGSFLWIRK